MAKVGPPSMRARRRMSELEVRSRSRWRIRKEDSQAVSLRVGINGDVMGGMKAPIEVGKRRMDVTRVNPALSTFSDFRKEAS